MTLMAAGQALFHAHRQPLPEEKGFRDVPWLLWRLWDRIRGMQKTGPPRIFVQLILPSSRDRLQDALHVLQTEQQAAASGGHSASSSSRSSSSGGQDATAPVLDSASEATAWVQYDAHKAGQGEGAQQRQHSSAQPADSEELAARPSPLVAVWKWLSAQVWTVLLHLVQEESAMAAGQERGSRQSQVRGRVKHPQRLHIQCCCSGRLSMMCCCAPAASTGSGMHALAWTAPTWPQKPSAACPHLHATSAAYPHTIRLHCLAGGGCCSVLVPL
jgi:hypothetical protein